MFLTIICECLTTKGPSFIFSFLIIFLTWYFKKKEKVSLKMLTLVFLVCILLGSFQIENYFLNKNAPRNLFLRYGIITAKEHFPIGTGFGTFGSDMAFKHYSPLYMKYGFNKLYGMNKKDGSFLNDTYWPMIIGQFGIFGLILYLWIYIKFFKEIINIKERRTKAITLSLFIYMMIHSMGSAILTSSEGVMVFMFFSLILNSKEEINEGYNKSNKTEIIKY